MMTYRSSHSNETINLLPHLSCASHLCTRSMDDHVLSYNPETAQIGWERDATTLEAPHEWMSKTKRLNLYYLTQLSPSTPSFQGLSSAFFVMGDTSVILFNLHSQSTRFPHNATLAGYRIICLLIIPGPPRCIRGLFTCIRLS